MTTSYIPTDIPTNSPANTLEVGVILLISTHCAHCALALQILTGMVKQGRIAKLEVINLEQSPQTARRMGVRSVPWMRIGDFVFEGVQTQQEISNWVSRAADPNGERDYLQELLVTGKVNDVIAYIRKRPAALKVVSGFLDDADAKINLKLGVGVVFETFAGEAVMADVIPDLTHYLEHNDPRVRADACHYLSLSGDKTLIPEIKKCLQDEDKDVREIATDGLQQLQDSADD